MSGKLNLKPHQHQENWKPSKIETVIVPSTNQPSFGSYVVFDFRDLNVLLQDITLQFNVSAISTMTSGMFNPSFFWFTRIEILQANNVIQTIYPGEQFLLHNLFQSDEKRALMNQSTGLYSSTAQRTTLATATNNYYLPLWSYFKQSGGIELLKPAHNVQVRVYMDTLANNTSGTGTAVATINYANLLAKVVRLRAHESDAKHNELMKRPYHFKFNDLHYMTSTVNSGVSSTNIILTGINGPVNFLMFTVRPTASLTGNNEFVYTQISSYSLLDSAGTNMVGGQDLNSEYSLTVLARDWILSSYLAEQAVGITDNKANVYLYSFSADPADGFNTGLSYGAKLFNGSEQLKVNFNSALGANVQVDIYAFCDSVVEVSPNNVRKLTVF